MSKKKRGNAPKVVALPPKKKGVSMATWIGGAVALAAVAIFVIFWSGGKGAAAVGANSATTGAATAAGAAPAEEQKYMGRLLPAGYTEPPVGAAAAYAATFKMSDVTAKQDKKQTSVSASDVASKKIVFFEYKKAGAESVPMVAYMKPSGKLFVGVSYCIPCKGTRQRIEADGTLTCESCGTKRDLETGVGLSGACKLYPLDELAATVSGGRIILQNADIENWTPQRLDRPVG